MNQPAFVSTGFVDFSFVFADFSAAASTCFLTAFLSSIAALVTSLLLVVGLGLSAMTVCV